jgi:hypothetical protein
MTPEQFEVVVRAELKKRDLARRARIGDPAVYASADQDCVNAVMAAAGYGEPDDDAARPVRRGRRAARVNEEAAFGGGS